HEERHASIGGTEAPAGVRRDVEREDAHDQCTAAAASDSAERRDFFRSLLPISAASCFWPPSHPSYQASDSGPSGPCGLASAFLPSRPAAIPALRAACASVITPASLVGADGSEGLAIGAAPSNRSSCRSTFSRNK